MYLTRIDINPRRRSSRRVLASPHLLHGAVNTCFPPSSDAGRVLWRVDEHRNGTYLYLVSSTRPDATGFVEEHGWPLADSWKTRDYGTVLDAVVAGRHFAFRLRANPVRHVRPAGDERGRGKRVGHVTADQQLAWLRERAGDWGLDVGEDGESTARVVERKIWTFPRGGRRVTVATAVFEGRLRVTDPHRLKAQLVEGFGPAKAYGCGLMTLASAGEP